VIVGVNRFQDELAVEVPILKVDPELERGQRDRLARHRQQRDATAAARALGRVEEVAAGTTNLLPVMREALLAGATLGEICHRLRQVFGTFQPRASS
jgi:methylmalonyl-CoA mutase N-terminal domain/subunit